jgi:hypothetical protein
MQSLRDQAVIRFRRAFPIGDDQQRERRGVVTDNGSFCTDRSAKKFALSRPVTRHSILCCVRRRCGGCSAPDILFVAISRRNIGVERVTLR